MRRRAATMARPARVRMRRRKPCVLARRRLFGWKVRLLTRFSVACGPDGTRRPDPESNRVVQLQIAAAGDRNRQAHGSTPPLQARATGMRKRSPTRSVNDTGAAEGGSNRLEPIRGRQTLHHRPPRAIRKSTRRAQPLPRWRRLSAACRVVRLPFARLPRSAASAVLHRVWTIVWKTSASEAAR